MNDPIERAEEIYHRLALGEYGTGIVQRWLGGVETWLFSALEELSAESRSWLANQLHVELPPEDRAQASLDVWEQDAHRRARELLALDQAPSALATVQERPERSAASPLFLTEAQIHSALGRTTRRSRRSTAASAVRSSPAATRCGRIYRLRRPGSN